MQATSSAEDEIDRWIGSSLRRMPQLQSPACVDRFLLRLGFRTPSSALFCKIGEAHTEGIHRWAKANAITIHNFKKGENNYGMGRRLRGRGRGGRGHRWPVAYSTTVNIRGES